MNAAPGGKDTGAAVVVGHAGLSWPSQGQGPSSLGEEMSEQPPMPSTPLIPHMREGLRSPAQRVAIPTLGKLSSTLSWRNDPETVSCNHLLTKCSVASLEVILLLSLLLPSVPKMQSQTPEFSLQLHMLSKV